LAAKVYFIINLDGRGKKLIQFSNEDITEKLRGASTKERVKEIEEKLYSSQNNFQKIKRAFIEEIRQNPQD
jgi:hypothetical protein